MNRFQIEKEKKLESGLYNKEINALLDVPNRYHNVSFDDVWGDRKEEVGILEEGYGLVIWGPPSCGKTRIGVATLRKAWEKFRMNGSWRSSTKCLQKGIPPFIEIDILVMDGFGREYLLRKTAPGETEAIIEQTLRERAELGKLTILTTELSPQELKARYGDSFAKLMNEKFKFRKMKKFEIEKREEEKKEMRNLLGNGLDWYDIRSIGSISD